MSWRATVFWSLLAALVGFGLFHVKYQVQKLEDQLTRLNRDIVREQDQIHVLKAEWTYLNRPERIEELSKRFLDLAAPKPNQMGTIAQLPMRSSDTPVDPTASKSPSPAPKAPAPTRSPPPMFVPTPVAAGSRGLSQPIDPSFAEELSVGLVDGPIPGGGR